MAPLVSVDELRQHVETDLAPTALTRLLAAADEDIVSGYGPHASQTDDLHPEQLDEFLFLTRPVATITSVTETVGDTATVLAADDYELHGDRMLRRLTTGTNPRSLWGDRVVIVYAPIPNNAQRIRVTIDLVKLYLRYSGVSQQSLGDYSETVPEMDAERTRILSALRTGAGIFVV